MWQKLLKATAISILPFFHHSSVLILFKYCTHQRLYSSVSCVVGCDHVTNFWTNELQAEFGGWCLYEDSLRGRQRTEKPPLVSPCFFSPITLNAEVRGGAAAVFLDYKMILRMEVLNQGEKRREEKPGSLVTIEPSYQPCTAYLWMSSIQDRNES